MVEKVLPWWKLLCNIVCSEFVLLVRLNLFLALDLKLHGGLYGSCDRNDAMKSESAGRGGLVVVVYIDVSVVLFRATCGLA